MLVAVAAGLLLGRTAPVCGDERGPSIEVKAPEGEVTLGQRLRIKVLARAGEGWLWGELRISTPGNGAWAVIEPPSALAGAHPPVWELVLMPLQLGELELPPIEVTARAEDGSTRDLVGGEDLKLTVVSTLGDEAEAAEPAALRPPLGVRGLPWEWALPALLAALPVAMLAAWVVGRRRSAAAAARTTLPPYPELEHLLANLRDRVGREEDAGLCDRLAWGLRRYLERRSGEPALEMTSSELRLLARRSGWPEQIQRAVQRVMGVADGVRFGRRRAGEAQLVQAIDEAQSAAGALEAYLAPEPDGAGEAGSGEKRSASLPMADGTTSRGTPEAPQGGRLEAGQ